MHLVDVLAIAGARHPGLEQYYGPDGEPRDGPTPGDPLAEFIVATIRSSFREGRENGVQLLVTQRALGEARAQIDECIFTLHDAWLASTPARKDA